jgi:hypothetical protein
MKVNIVEVPTPMISEFTLMASPDVNLLKENKKLRIVASHHTKTRISTTMQLGQARVGVNFKVEGVKTFEESEHSYFTGNVNVMNYFVKSKKQNKESYKEYVTEVVKDVVENYFNISLDEVTIELEVDRVKF